MTGIFQCATACGRENCRLLLLWLSSRLALLVASFSISNEGFRTILAARGEFFYTFASRGGCERNPPLQLLQTSKHQLLSHTHTTHFIKEIYAIFAVITGRHPPLPGGGPNHKNCNSSRT